MEHSAEIDTRDCVNIDSNNQSEYPCNPQRSYSGRMVVVSDIDDDDASFAHSKHTISFGDENIVKIGSSSTTDSMVVDGAHRITPLTQGSEEALARALPRDIPKVGRSNTVLPFFPITDDKQTLFTIQPRKQDSHRTTKLVDKYGARRAQNESTEQGDFNACQRTSLKLKDTEDANRGIPGNLFEPNLDVSHKIADTTTTIRTTPNDHDQHSLTTIHHPSQSQHQNHQNLIKPRIPHKISFADDSKMPSKQTRCLPRQRSRAIAIKPSEFILPSDSHGKRMEDTNNNKEARQCDVELYDYATWRMYNRIIDHRRKNPLPVEAQEQQPQEQEQQQFTSRLLKNTQTLGTNQSNGHANGSMPMANGQSYFVRLPMYTEDDYVSGNEDEEIFDFEL